MWSLDIQQRRFWDIQPSACPLQVAGGTEQSRSHPGGQPPEVGLCSAPLTAPLGMEARSPLSTEEAVFAFLSVGTLSLWPQRDSQNPQVGPLPAALSAVCLCVLLFSFPLVNLHSPSCFWK